MAILVKTPITSNGRDPYLDGTGKMIYKETVLQDAALPIITSQNKLRPTHLKRVIVENYGEPIKPQKPGGASEDGYIPREGEITKPTDKKPK